MPASSSRSYKIDRLIDHEDPAEFLGTRRSNPVTGASRVRAFSDEFLAGDGALNHSTKAFAGVLIDDGHELDRSSVGGDVELEVHGRTRLGASATTVFGAAEMP